MRPLSVLSLYVYGARTNVVGPSSVVYGIGVELPLSFAPERQPCGVRNTLQGRLSVSSRIGADDLFPRLVSAPAALRGGFARPPPGFVTALYEMTMS